MSIAAERIERLHHLAAGAAREGEDDRAREYVRLAKRIAERNRLRFPRRFERSVCDRCGLYLRPGRTARTRLRDGHLTVTCQCGGQKRYPYRGRV
ncbi:ribonuclease P protein component 4 [Natronorarus salvus]|uniref:ribonuclease P protein component 4 n=1 Tax=Natronorarus salvus TaxID=3117733 RepID=UPI002F26621B